MGYDAYNTTMNTPRIYCPVPLAAGLRTALPEAAARHVLKVLRMRSGDELTLFDGAGGEYACRIAANGSRGVAVEVLEWHALEREAPLGITLVQALQAGDKMDMTVQKAVELGVARIVPVTSRRSVVRLDGARALRRIEHWRAVAVAACEQCGRNRLPQIAALENLESWLGKSPAPGALRLMLAPQAQQTLHGIAPPAPGAALELLIGAEGGLAPEEMHGAVLAGFVSVRLGPRILRTETAGLAALAAIQCLWGDFSGRVAHV